MSQDTPLERTYRSVARTIVDDILPEASDERKGLSMRIIVHHLRSSLVPLISDIREFHEKFGLAYDGPPRVLPDDMRKFRVGFLDEEVTEYEDARLSSKRLNDLGDYLPAEPQEQMHEELDALVDLVYVALGTAYLQGFNFAEAWRRVHTANMAKVRVDHPENSKRGSSYDIVKPEGWSAPVLLDLVV